MVHVSIVKWVPSPVHAWILHDAHGMDTSTIKLEYLHSLEK